MSRSVTALPVVEDVPREMFSCSWTTGHGATWATLGGELDASTAPAFDLALREAEATPDAELIVVDLRGLTFMDCRGMSVCVSSSVRMSEAGRRLVAIRGPRAVDRVFSLSGNAGAVDIFDLEPPEPAVGVLLKMAAHADATYPTAG